MASFSVPCPKVSPPPPLLAASQKPRNAAFFTRSESGSNPALAMACSQRYGRGLLDGLKMHAQLNDVAVEKVSNAQPALDTALTGESESQDEVPYASSASPFMTQVMDLVKLVDSKDIVELQLKQMDYELHIKKKEALMQPTPVAFAPPPIHQAMHPQLPPAPTATAAPVPSTPASAPTSAAPPKPKSSLPSFKCPMAGNFYRSPAPGAPPFVKVGDKVQKGQVICIIEAMKLMNEIEADQSGTIVEILVDDGKPVSVDLPLFVIEP
ncbi:biotin carboxyl carrier protein of acetyl-CoA carboxylase, chloroplastic-like [Andrographis paniculata]|uniref:biotin carboxyl carrier protein of acetyl-CoA carboxylase, chloroplastic-like n=1 Tax=Andrographis paniculata TaxID=175694 RepID=UPI0021E89512|nr:biotin carboxyl carrier protein of acetyl-CoA carboxylase, chloroplastic-like [Andrographis paniculata]XP_051148177.1 biotin carboxyl carrier protein of acetyl-CoA carboxylase, chloroplastic-like [Andrographis paniculata]XP_051148179.1 biotin carboxyl carrier protein of acetyl-CoA carboxylase, chloroplastic-like [Andrographis paniculata]